MSSKVAKGFWGRSLAMYTSLIYDLCWNSPSSTQIILLNAQLSIIRDGILQTPKNTIMNKTGPTTNKLT